MEEEVEEEVEVVVVEEEEAEVEAVDKGAMATTCLKVLSRPGRVPGLVRLLRVTPT